MDSIRSVNLSQPEKKKHFQQPKTHHDSIRKLLTILAASQQATLQETGYVTYCNGLDGFLLEDLETAIGELCLRERPEGKTAFPSLATIVSETQRAANRRFQRARQERERQSVEYARAHPEEFVPFSEILAAVNERRELREKGYTVPIEPRPRDGFYGYEREGALWSTVLAQGVSGLRISSGLVRRTSFSQDTKQRSAYAEEYWE